MISDGELASWRQYYRDNPWVEWALFLGAPIFAFVGSMFDAARVVPQNKETLRRAMQARLPRRFIVLFASRLCAAGIVSSQELMAMLK